VPPDRPALDLVVHAGTGKAGSSSIQRMMNHNRERIAAAGHLYPRTPGVARHGKLALFLKTDEELDLDPAWHRTKISDPTVFRRRFRKRLDTEIEESGLHRVVFSEETLFGCPTPMLHRLRELTDELGRSLRVVVYLRRQDDHLVSRYQQGVKVGEIRRLADRTLHLDYSSTYDYAGRLARLEQLLEPDELVVRRFEREAFRGGSLFDDFLDAAGIGLTTDEVEVPQDANISLDAESVEFLRLLNLRRVHAEGARVGVIDNRALVRRLAAVGSGPTLTLPDAELDAFMARWADGNTLVARRHFGEDALFRSPRKTSGTVAEQRLDPGRLDHFLAVAEVPEGLHAPLRILAEQEARR
jgi:hypothetical protein